MGYAVGAMLAMGTAVFARVAGLDRDRSFYPTVLVIVASYYVLFAVMGGSTSAVVQESIMMGAFAVLAVTGRRYGQWIVAAGLAAHGVQDLFHASIVSNAGVPEWWPAFCMAYDVAAGAWLAFGTRSRRWSQACSCAM